MVLIVGRLLKLPLTYFTLNLAVERAMEVIAVCDTWCPKAHALVKVIGLDGLSSLVGCFGLSLAFLSVSCGVVMGSRAAMMKEQTRSFLETGCIGLLVFLGCGIAGALLGMTSMSLITLGLRGFCVMGFVLSLTLFFIYKQHRHPATNPTRVLVCLAVTFMTMHLGVCSPWRRVTDPKQPRSYIKDIYILFLVPAVFLLGYSTEKIVFRKPSAYMTVIFKLLVPLTGFYLGVEIVNHSKENPYFSETFYTVQSLVYTLVMLAGLIGVLLGVMSVCFREAERAQALSLWICVPATVILSCLDVKAQHVPLLSVIEWWFGAGGVLGLISGLAGASGVSLGLVIMSTGEQLWSYIVKVFVLMYLALLCDLISFNIIVVILTLPLTLQLLTGTDTPIEQVNRNKVTVLESALSFAALGLVMMGATVLGAAGLLTAVLGPGGLYGVYLAILIAVIETMDLLNGW